jgi:flagellar basal body rod protein FlgB
MGIIQKIAQDSGLRKAQIGVATDNLSRAPIPGEKEKYVKFQKLLGNGSSLTQTHPHHLSGTAASHGYSLGQNKHTLETSLNGNSIDEEAQHAQIAEASIQMGRNLAMFRALSNQNKTILDR